MASVERWIIVSGGRADEGDFVEAVANKDEAATQRLVEQLKEDQKSGGSLGLRLVSLAFGARVEEFLASRFAGDRAAAEEAWNDTLLRIFLRIETFDASRSSFRTWVYNQARYAALDRRRALSRPSGLPFERFASDDVSPLTTHERDALREAFKKLNETQRRLLWERFVFEREPAEIARQPEFVGVPADHIRVYVNRAAARLREVYEEILAENH
jgi:RNA polymerase sigma-70 factor (ECF subfamily)